MPAFASVALLALAMYGSAAFAESYRAPRFFGSDLEPDELLDVIATAPSRSFKPVGRTSVVLRMRTTARVTAAMKVRSHDVPNGYRYEIAAYRISRLLGLDNVPPAVSRTVRWDEIKGRFHEDKLDRRPVVRREVLWDEDGNAPGAAIFWVKGMRSVGYEKRSTWEGWLRDEAVPPGREALARDLSTMVVFDLLIGNWDRFSGGNLPSDSSRTRAILRDNDRAFSTPLLQRRYDALVAALARTERFSRSLIERLAMVDGDALAMELARDPSHATTPLLNPRQIADVLDRRATVLSHVAALIEERGEARVLVFP